jgi:hypothetical protein
MPSMREWTEITVDEDLLIPVVRELLDMAVNPNQVEIVHGTNGRVILAEVHLAEHWYQERLKRDEEIPAEDPQSSVQTEVVAAAEKIVAPAPLPPPPPPAPVPPVPAPKKLESSIGAPAAKAPASPVVQTPVRRVPAPIPASKPSASPNSEDS